MNISADIYEGSQLNAMQQYCSLLKRGKCRLLAPACLLHAKKTMRKPPCASAKSD